MGQDGVPEDVEHVFTREEREAQLTRLEILCNNLADAFAAHGHPHEARLFRGRAHLAERARREGYRQADLNEVGGPFPNGPSWLDPRATDCGLQREPWQDEVAILHAQARSAALEVRSIATVRHRP
jgi:hypothetical protein